jgi:uncharacterized protein YjbI with pentapeptide repeats
MFSNLVNCRSGDTNLAGADLAGANLVGLSSRRLDR